MRVRCAQLSLFVLTIPLWPDTPCDGIAAYSPCELTFEIPSAELTTHSNPYQTVEFQAEFRSPRFHTYLMPGFWDGGRKLVIRFTPTEPGQWTYRLTSNLASIAGQQGTFNAAQSDAPGFVDTANVHHWAT